MSNGDAPWAIATPKPIKNLAPTNMPKVYPKLWSSTPIIMMVQPIITPVRLPSISAAYGTKGRATSEPTDMIQLRSPSWEAVGWKSRGQISFISLTEFVQETLTGFPGGKRLKTVHHGAIVSVRRRSQDNEHQDKVQAPHSLLLIPCYSRELLAREFKGFFRTLKIHVGVDRSDKLCVASRLRIASKSRMINKFSSGSLHSMALWFSIRENIAFYIFTFWTSCIHFILLDYPELSLHLLPTGLTAPRSAQKLLKSYTKGTSNTLSVSDMYLQISPVEVSPVKWDGYKAGRGKAWAFTLVWGLLINKSENTERIVPQVSPLNPAYVKMEMQLVEVWSRFCHLLTRMILIRLYSQIAGRHRLNMSCHLSQARRISSCGKWIAVCSVRPYSMNTTREIWLGDRSVGTSSIH